MSMEAPAGAVQEWLSLRVDADRYVGIDIGGTETRIATGYDSDPSRREITTFPTSEFGSVDEVLEWDMQRNGSKASYYHLGLAGSPNKDTGSILMPNTSMPVFDPTAATEKYGTEIAADGDVKSAIGVLLPGAQVEDLEIVELKPGEAPQNATDVLMTVSSGVGGAALIRTRIRTGGHDELQLTIAGSEFGHTDIGTTDDETYAYARRVQAEHGEATQEKALAGLYGVDSLVDHISESTDIFSSALDAAIAKTREDGGPTGAVLLRFAEQGDEMAIRTLDRMGLLLGGLVRNFVSAFDADRVFLMGGVSRGMAEYLADKTAMLQEFVRPGTMYAEKRANVPIYLIMNQYVGVLGALERARLGRLALQA